MSKPVGTSAYLEEKSPDLLGHFDRELLIGGSRTPHRVGIVDADLIDHGTRFPNLALLKISGYYKDAGAAVTLIENYEVLNYSDYDQIFVSKVFTFSEYERELLQHGNVTLGGTGFFEDGGENLPLVVEHHMPDYHLYDKYVERRIAEGRRPSYFEDYMNYSIGFATRGCFRKCDFCVNKKYDHTFFHSHIKEWYDPSRKYIYLWDDNILAYPHWKDVFDELAEINKPFQFRQGMDVRLMTDEKAEVLSHARYRGDFIFAFDHIEDKKRIEKSLALWRKHCTRETKLYVICGFDSQDAADIENTFERIRVLFKYACLPYIMRYEAYKQSPYKRLYIAIARWCNQPNIVKKMSFRQFCEANQRMKKRPGLCSSMQALTDFEAENPDIAAKYFDIRWEDQPMVQELKQRRGKKRGLVTWDLPEGVPEP